MLTKKFVEETVAEYQTTMLHYAGRLLRNRHDAQEVVQNTFIKLFKAIQKKQFTGKGTKTWLFRVAHNEAMDLMRKEARLRELHQKHSEHEVNLDLADKNDGLEMKQKIVLECIEQLDISSKQIVLLRLQEGLSYKEIAEITGRTTGNVGCILHNAVKQISEQIQIKEQNHEL
ncbi:MAG: RNA polymerase sigma factor [Lentisphaerae bacterium]|nr:RNA polymerase sigma factor [Lentisphaerota bacterium]